MLGNELTRQIIGAAIEVHKLLGPGLLESAYEDCLCHVSWRFGESILKNKNQFRWSTKEQNWNADSGWTYWLKVRSSLNSNP